MAPAPALTLYTCKLDRGGPKFHPCRRVHEALAAAGHHYETIVFDRNRPFGLFTEGKRPELKELSGQEKLPVLRLSDGTTLNGSGPIIAWARDNAPGG
jgi:glutathione S-transferase